MTAMQLSAVIPTRDRPELLGDALSTLAGQDVRAGFMEVIVIDDGSTPDLRSVVERASALGSPVQFRYARQDPSGLNVGRNHGAALAKAPVIAFLDDDVLVAPAWAGSVADAFASTGCDALAGRVRLQLEGPEPSWLTDKLRRYLSELDLGDDWRWLDAASGELPVGANCAVSRAAFDRLGGFAAGLDRNGTSLVSNGDTEFFARLGRDGGSLVYWPEAALLHRVPADRLTRAWFIRRARAQGVSDALLEPAVGGTARVAELSREVVRAGRALPILARNVADRRGPVAASVWLSYCRGRFGALASRAR